MAIVQVRCPTCGGLNVVKYGRQPNGAQRYCCQSPDCERQVFLLNYKNRIRLPEIKRQIIEMALSGNGIRETARQLNISPATVIEVFDLLSNFGSAPHGAAGMHSKAL